MALDRLNGFSGGYNAYNIPQTEDARIKFNDQRLMPGMDNKTPSKEPEEQKKGLDLTVSEVVERGNATIENVAISFGQYDSSDLLGGRGLASSDMQKAISGMQRDQILHEYQYFVGGKDLTGKDSNIIANTEDGLVIKL